ncbi:unnamed protein product, partial [Rotaria magnacalcarata]
MTFIKYKLIEFDLCIGSSSVSIPSSAREFDIWMWDQYPRLLSSFVQCIVIDGHQKYRRRVCRAKNVQVSTEEFESLTIGCCRTPSFGSRFRELHQVLDEKNVTTEPLTKQKQNKKTKNDEKTNNGPFDILAGVTNYKIVITFSEIFRSENLREIISLLCSTIR